MLPPLEHTDVGFIGGSPQGRKVVGLSPSDSSTATTPKKKQLWIMEGRRIFCFSSVGPK